MDDMVPFQNSRGNPAPPQHQLLDCKSRLAHILDIHRRLRQLSDWQDRFQVFCHCVQNRSLHSKMNSSSHKASLPDTATLQNQWASSSRALLHEPDSLLAHLHRGEMYRMARDGPAQQQQLFLRPPRPLRDATSNALRSSSVSLQDLRDVIQQATFIMDGSNEDGGATTATTDARSDSTHSSSSSSSHVHDLQRRHSYPPSQ